MNKFSDESLELFKQFGQIYVINRECDIERRESIKKELDGVDYRLFTATDGWKMKELFTTNETNERWDGWTPGAAGLIDTKIKILTDAINNRYDSILVMEDDIIFNHLFSRYGKQCWDMKPADWELFHFACKDYERPERLGKIKRLSAAWSCQIYAINSKIFEEYREELMKFDKPIDLVTSKYFHPRGKSYASKYNLIDTVPNMSAIRNKFVSY